MRKISAIAVAALLIGASAANAQFCGSQAVGLAIPDNVPAGISSTINVANAFAVTGIAVTVSMNHSWVGDLIVTLTAPNGNTRNIMRRTGSFTATGVGDSSNLIAGGYRFTDRFGATNFADISCGANISMMAAGTPSGNWWSEAGVTGAPAPNTAGGTTYNLRLGDYIASSNNHSVNYAGSYVEVNLLADLGSQSNGNWRLTVSDNAGADTGTLVSWTLALLPEPASMSLLALGGLLLARRRR